MLEVVYNRQEPPKMFSKSIYLAGTNIVEEDEVHTWRDRVIDILKAKKFDGCVFFPEESRLYEDGDNSTAYPDPNDLSGLKAQTEWERTWMNAADAVLFWFPRNLKCLGLTSNVEYGKYFSLPRVFVGSPFSAKNQDYNCYLKVLNNMAEKKWYEDLETIVSSALDYIGVGSYRRDFERKIPLEIWTNQSFVSWKDQMERNDIGAKITDIEVIYEEPTSPGSKDVFLWTVRPTIYLEAEKRYKKGDIVCGRPDVCSIVIYSDEEDPRIVLVKEFRPSIRNKEGYVLELPSGSYHGGAKGVRSALMELKEETGIDISWSQEQNAILVGERQQLPTLCANANIAHKMKVSSLEMFNIEDFVKDKTFGLEEETERTYVEIKRFSEILKEQRVDWTTLGIITQALYGDSHEV